MSSCFADNLENITDSIGDADFNLNEDFDEGDDKNIVEMEEYVSANYVHYDTSIISSDKTVYYGQTCEFKVNLINDCHDYLFGLDVFSSIDGKLYNLTLDSNGVGIFKFYNRNTSFGII